MTDRPDWSPTAVDVVLRPEWAALEGTDWERGAGGDDKAFEDQVGVTYNVPAGRTLYITHVTFACVANLAVSGDLNQMCYCFLNDNTAATNHLRIGGNGGGSVILSKPVVIPAGHQVGAYIVSYANHAVNMGVSAFGYEV